MNQDASPADRYNDLALVLELPVVIVEGALYKWVMKYSWLASMGISLMANLASYLFGLWFLDVAFDW